jgi:hypothetical protein
MLNCIEMLSSLKSRNIIKSFYSSQIDSLRELLKSELDIYRRYNVSDVNLLTESLIKVLNVEDNSFIQYLIFRDFFLTFDNSDAFYLLYEDIIQSDRSGTVLSYIDVYNIILLKGDHRTDYHILYDFIDRLLCSIYNFIADIVRDILVDVTVVKKCIFHILTNILNITDDRVESFLMDMWQFDSSFSRMDHIEFKFSYSTLIDLNLKNTTYDVYYDHENAIDLLHSDTYLGLFFNNVIALFAPFHSFVTYTINKYNCSFLFTEIADRLSKINILNEWNCRLWNSYVDSTHNLRRKYTYVGI